MQHLTNIEAAPTPIDNWKEFKANETAKRAIEIAIAGGHEIHFSPVEGHALQWPDYDIDRLKGERRELALWWAAHFPGGNAMSIEAAHRQVANCATAMHYLAEGASLPCPAWRPDQAASPSCVISVDVKPISLADYLLPPPAEPIAPVLARIAAARARRGKVQSLDYRAAELMKQFARYVPIDDATAARIIQVARTVEALAYGGDFIGRMALAEAISYYRRPEPSRERPTHSAAQEPVTESPAPASVESEAPAFATVAAFKDALAIGTKWRRSSMVNGEWESSPVIRVVARNQARDVAFIMAPEGMDYSEQEARAIGEKNKGLSWLGYPKRGAWESDATGMVFLDRDGKPFMRFERAPDEAVTARPVEAEIPAPESVQTPESPIAPPEPVEATSEPENPAPEANSGPLSPEVAFAAWLTAQFGVWIIAGRQTAKMTAAGKRAVTPRQYATLRTQWEHGNIEAAPPAPPLVEKGAADMAAQIAELMARVAALEGVATVSNQETVGHLSSNAQKPESVKARDQMSPKQPRTPAQIRLLMRYLAMRKERAELRGKRRRAVIKARDMKRAAEKEGMRAMLYADRLTEAQNQAATLGADLRLATGRMEQAETALAAVEARANGWPPAAVCVKSVTFASRRAA